MTPISTNERAVLTVLAEKDVIEPSDCARLAGLGIGLTQASLHSLANKGLARANQVRKGLTKKPDGTWSISTEGRELLPHT